MSYRNLNKDLDGVTKGGEQAGIDAFMSKMASDTMNASYDYDHPVKQNRKGVTLPPKRPASGVPSGPGSDKKSKTYGRGAGVSPGKMDKVYELERENTTLKTKENLLSAEIGKMKTKMRRLEEMMKKRGNSNSDNLLPEDIKNQLKNEIGDMNEDNRRLKEQNKKLKAIERELAMKSVAKKAPANKFSHVKGKLNLTTQRKGDGEFQKLVEELKTQVVASYKKNIQLTEHRDRLQVQFSNVSGSKSLMAGVNEQQKELTRVNNEIAELNANLQRGEAIWQETKGFIDQKQGEIRQLTDACARIEQKNYQVSNKAREAKQLAENLASVKREKDEVERLITSVTTSPFLEDKKSGETLAQQRARLDALLARVERECQKSKAEEFTQANKVKEMGERLGALKAQNQMLSEQHADERKAYQERNGDVPVRHVEEDLARNDRDAYARAVLDSAAQDKNYRDNWMLIERPDQDGKKLQQLTDAQKIDRMKTEIVALRHETRDVAAHLHQTSELVSLQGHLETDNMQYLAAEKVRLQHLAQQNQGKAQKLAADVAEQKKRIQALEASLGLGPAETVKRPASKAGRDELMNVDTFADADADGLEVKPSENVLDVKIFGADLNKDILRDFLGSYMPRTSPDQILTLATIAYYDHPLTTSAPAQGAKPQYSTNASFRNPMDGPYFDYLASSSAKIEIHLSGNNKEHVLLGTATIPLQRLTTGAIYGAAVRPAEFEDNYKITLSAGVFGAAKKRLESGAELGTLRVAMRLRKPIDGAVRDTQYLSQINEATRTGYGEPASKVGRKFIVTVTVNRARGLKTRSGTNSSKIAPFYQYEFYSHPEFVSKTGSGPDAEFGEPRPYDLEVTPACQDYLENQSLLIHVVDDNAPIGGIARGGQGTGDETDLEDLIGTASVPLANIAAGRGIDGEFEVRNGNECFGKLQVKIVVVDTLKSQVQGQTQQRKTGAGYQTRYQNDVRMRIAQKLCHIKTDTDKIFGVFTGGKNNCTLEDFKYYCRKTLKLQEEISDRELDMFLKGQTRLENKNNINQQDFIEIFSAAINQARAQFQENAAVMEQTQNWNKQQPSINVSYASTDGRATQGLSAPIEYGRNHAKQVLIKCILASSLEEILQEVERRTKSGTITFKDLSNILEMWGGASPTDIEKVKSHLLGTGVDKIFKSTIQRLLEESKNEARFSNPSIQRFNEMVLKETRSIAENFMQKDINQDGVLNIDGFKSALLQQSVIQDYKITLPQLNEIFNLISERSKEGGHGQEFHYVEYICTQADNAKQYFQRLQGYDKINQSINLNESSINMGPMETSIDQSLSRIVDPARQRQASFKQQTVTGKDSRLRNKKEPTQALQEAKRKIEDYLIVNDVTLSILFNVIDSNSDNRLTRQEFKHKLRGLAVGLVDEEIEELFQDLDENNDGNIQYEEFIKQFTSINTAQIIQRMRKIMYGAQTSAQYIFNQHCDTNAMNVSQFKSMLHSMFPKRIVDFEIEGIHDELITMQNKSTDQPSDKIKLEFFHTIFGMEEQEQQFQTGIEDIIKPLATVMKKLGLTVDKLFERYDFNNNQMLSADEIQGAVKGEMNMILTKEEVNTMQEFFMAKYKRTQVRQPEFRDLLDKKTVRQYRPKDAKQALAKMKSKFNKSGNETLEKYLTNFAPQVKTTSGKKQILALDSGEMTLREFKRAMYSKGWFTQMQINNLAKYMDRGNDGIILIKEVKQAMDGDFAPGDPRPRAKR